MPEEDLTRHCQFIGSWSRPKPEIPNSKFDEVIGYFQYSYFREEHMFFFEYLCIKSKSSRGLISSPVIRTIREFLAQNYRPDPTVIFDVAHEQLPSGERVSDHKRIAYFQNLRFRKIEFDYEYPVLQSYSARASYSADLMVMLPGGRTEVTASEMRTIIRCVYFKHYLRWDRPFLDAEKFAERQKLIDELYAKQIRQIASRHEFLTTGILRGSSLAWVVKNEPSLTALLGRIFAPKMPQLVFWITFLLFVQWILGSVWLLIPLALVLVVLDCLINNTKDSRKLLTTIMSRLRLVQPQ